MGEESDLMADPTTDGKPPVTDGEPKGVRFPEDELADIEKKADEAAAGKQDGAGEADGGDEDAARKAEDASVEKLQAFMVKKGIKDIGALVDLAADLESKNTRLSQDVQRLSVGATFQPAADAGGAHTVRQGEDEDIVLPDNPIELVTSKDKLKEFVLNLRKSVRADIERDKQRERVNGVLAEVAKKREADPEKFDRLKPTMIELAGRYPNANLDQLYSMAEKAKDSDEAILIEKVKKALGLDGTDTAKLKSVLGRVRTAPISGGSGQQVTIKTDEQRDKDDLLKAIMDSDKN